MEKKLNLENLNIDQVKLFLQNAELEQLKKAYPQMFKRALGFAEPVDLQSIYLKSQKLFAEAMIEVLPTACAKEWEAFEKFAYKAPGKQQFIYDLLQLYPKVKDSGKQVKIAEIANHLADYMGKQDEVLSVKMFWEIKYSNQNIQAFDSVYNRIINYAEFGEEAKAYVCRLVEEDEANVGDAIAFCKLVDWTSSLYGVEVLSFIQAKMDASNNASIDCRADALEIMKKFSFNEADNIEHLFDAEWRMKALLCSIHKDELVHSKMCRWMDEIISSLKWYDFEDLRALTEEIVQKNNGINSWLVALWNKALKTHPSADARDNKFWYFAGYAVVLANFSGFRSLDETDVIFKHAMRRYWKNPKEREQIATFLKKTVYPLDWLLEHDFRENLVRIYVDNWWLANVKKATVEDYYALCRVMKRHNIDIGAFFYEDENFKGLKAEAEKQEAEKAESKKQLAEVCKALGV